MTGRRKIATVLVALLALGAFASAARAGGGGASPDVLTLPGDQQIVVRVGNPLVQASGNGIAIGVRATAMLRGSVRIAGTTTPQMGTVGIERHDALLGWVAVASATVAADGSFRALWRPTVVGPVQLRAVPGLAVAGAVDDDPSLDATAPQLDLTVYRPGVASWYGPTSTEASTACGVPLTRTTLGVAHRTLPCGTPVALYYKGRTIVVPVIDRGPFITGRSWDLTHATHQALGGDDGLITLGALPLPVATPARGR